MCAGDFKKMLLLVLDKEIDLNYSLPCRITGQHNIHALFHCVFHRNGKAEEDKKRLFADASVWCV